MRMIKVYCDCCGSDLSHDDVNDYLDGKQLFVTMVVNNSGTYHFCFMCAKELLSAWNDKAREIRERKGI